jgi:hypothetical protein
MRSSPPICGIQGREYSDWRRALAARYPVPPEEGGGRSPIGACEARADARWWIECGVGWRPTMSDSSNDSKPRRVGTHAVYRCLRDALTQSTSNCEHVMDYRLSHTDTRYLIFMV